MPEPAVEFTSFSGSWWITRKNRSVKFALRYAASASMRASCLPAATAAHVVPAATFQFSISRRGLPVSCAIAISAAVGNSSLPTWYWWKIEDVRPVVCSQVRSAWSRGVLLNAPAAAPHRTPQLGTSLASTVHCAGWVGVGVGVVGLGAGEDGAGDGDGDGRRRHGHRELREVR